MCGEASIVLRWMIHRSLGLGIVAWLLLQSGAVLAQDSTEPELMEPLLQADLSILTGDVLRPNGIYYHDGYLYTGCTGDWTVYRLDAETGETITYIFGVKNAHTLYVEDGPIVWAPDFQDNQLVRISEETGIVPVRDGLAAPWGMAPSASDDTFFLTEWESDNLINMTRDGDIRVVASGFEDPSGLVVTEEHIYIANNGSARRAVEWLDISEDGDRTPQPLVSGLQQVTNLVMGPDNRLYMAYALGSRGVVGRVDPAACIAAGGCTTVDVELVLWTELSAPLAGLVVTPEMRLFVHTIFGAEIYWVDLPQGDVGLSDE